MKRKFTVSVKVEVDLDGYVTEYGLPVLLPYTDRPLVVAEVREWLDGLVQGSVEAALRPFDTFTEVVA